MKKLILFIVFLLTPLFVLADSDVSIESVSRVDKSDSVEELNNPSFNGMDISINVRFKDRESFIKYMIVINNKSNEDYEIKENNNFTDSNYFNYQYSYEGDSNIVEKNSKKTMYVTITYVKEVPYAEFVNNVYHEDNNMVISLSNKPSNPITMDIITVIVLLLCISLFAYYFLMKHKMKPYMLLLLLLVPVCIYAVNEIKVSIEAKIEIEEPDFFYVYHTSNNTIERISLNDERVTLDGNGNRIFNIVEETLSDRYYGGYFSAYRDANLNDEQIVAGDYVLDEEEREFAYRDNRTGGYWLSDSEGIPLTSASWGNFVTINDAYTESGITAKVEKDKVYYLKETFNRYFFPSVDVIKNKNTLVIEDFHVIVSVDDGRYNGVGFVNDVLPISNRLYGSVQNGDGPLWTIQASDPQLEHGWLCPSKATDLIGLNKSYELIPFFITKDGVKVTSYWSRTVNFNNLIDDNSEEGFSVQDKKIKSTYSVYVSE